MNFLIDTNIFIPLSPTGLPDLGAATSQAAEFARLAEIGGHRLYVHPAALEDIRRDPNSARRQVRQVQLDRYPVLVNPPPIQSRIEVLFGLVQHGSNDWVDHSLLAALYSDAADFLVTEDRGIHSKAARLELGDRVATLADAIQIVRGLSDITPVPLPFVQSLPAYALDSADPIFQSFRTDYVDFDAWLTKCKREHRQTWVIREPTSHSLSGVAIVKAEKASECPASIQGRVLKMCSFKIAEQYQGYRYGELLLKAVFSYVVQNNYDWLYVEVLPKYGHLIAFFEDFGFQISDAQCTHGDLVFTKPMAKTDTLAPELSPLDYHIRFGPAAVRLRDVGCFIVPILPKYHAALFPELQQQQAFLPSAFGNSIRKAYLSHSKTALLYQGAVLLFYRSHDYREVNCVGVVEGTLRSSSPEEVARYVGKRTVYSFAQIEALCSSEVLAILFRQTFLPQQAVSLGELVRHNVLRGAPQSITRVRPEGEEWIRHQLAA